MPMSPCTPLPSASSQLSGLVGLSSLLGVPKLAGPSSAVSAASGSPRTPLKPLQEVQAEQQPATVAEMVALFPTDAKAPSAPSGTAAAVFATAPLSNEAHEGIHAQSGAQSHQELSPSTAQVLEDAGVLAPAEVASPFAKASLQKALLPPSRLQPACVTAAVVEAHLANAQAAPSAVPAPQQPTTPEQAAKPPKTPASRLSLLCAEWEEECFGTEAVEASTKVPAFPTEAVAAAAKAPSSTPQPAEVPAPGPRMSLAARVQAAEAAEAAKTSPAPSSEPEAPPIATEVEPAKPVPTSKDRRQMWDMGPRSSFASKIGDRLRLLEELEAEAANVKSANTQEPTSEASEEDEEDLQPSPPPEQEGKPPLNQPATLPTIAEKNPTLLDTTSSVEPDAARTEVCKTSPKTADSIWNEEEF